jgi:hypothetical protein
LSNHEVKEDANIPSRRYMQRRMAYQPKQRLRLRPEFPTLVARTGMSLRAYAKGAGVSYATVQANLNPSQQPNRNPQGGMYAATAGKLANFHAKVTGTTPEKAYKHIIVEEHLGDRHCGTCEPGGD